MLDDVLLILVLSIFSFTLVFSIVLFRAVQSDKSLIITFVSFITHHSHLHLLLMIKQNINGRLVYFSLFLSPLCPPSI